MLARTDLVAGLGALGLDGRSVVIVHSSLRSFGLVDGGAGTVAEALASTCGTVVVPSGTWELTGVPAPPGLQRADNAARHAESWEHFDAVLAQAVPFSADLPIDKELGAVPEALRLRFDHVRGQHPLFSFLATGRHADDVVAGARPDWPLGPIEAVADLDGDVLLLGVGHRTNTAIHLAEQRLGRSRFRRYAKLQAGVWGELPNVPGQSHRFDDLEPALRYLTTETRIGNCRARLVKVRDVLEQATLAISRDPGALLCDEDECRCGAARRQREAVLARRSELGQQTG